MFCLYICPYVNTSHTHEKKPKHTFHLKRSLVSAAAVSQHACFYGFYAPFQVPLPAFTTPLSYAVLFPMKLDIVTVRSRMFFTWWVVGRVHISLTVPKKHLFEAPLFAHFLFIKDKLRIPCKTERTPFPGSVSKSSSLHPSALVIVVTDVKWVQTVHHSVVNNTALEQGGVMLKVRFCFPLPQINPNQLFISIPGILGSKILGLNYTSIMQCL